MNMTGLRVFLAAPYSQWMDPLAGRVHDHWRLRLDGLRTSFIRSGARVFSAHHNEQWGAGWLPADQCTPADFRAMQVADVVCAITGSPPSGGVAVELGWASALGKPMVLIRKPDAGCSPLIDGMGSITRASFLEDDGVWGPELFAKIVNSIAFVLDAEPIADGSEGLEPAFVGPSEEAIHQ